MSDGSPPESEGISGITGPSVVRESPRAGVVRLVLNRPHRRNALTMECMDELSAALIDVARSESNRVVILAARGPSFCAGADLSTFSGDPVNLGAHELWDRLERLPVPVIAAVQGHAITGGLLLAVSCDLIVAATDAIFQDTHARLGLIPTGGEAQKLPRRVGLSLAREMLFTSGAVDAEEMWRRGVVSRVVSVSDLEETALNLASNIAAGSPRSVRAIKRMVNRGIELPYAAALREDHIDGDWGRANFDPDSIRDAQISQFLDRSEEDTT